MATPGDSGNKGPKKPTLVADVSKPAAKPSDPAKPSITVDSGPTPGTPTLSIDEQNAKLVADKKKQSDINLSGNAPGGTPTITSGTGQRNIDLTGKAAPDASDELSTQKEKESKGKDTEWEKGGPLKDISLDWYPAFCGIFGATYGLSGHAVASPTQGALNVGLGMGQVAIGGGAILAGKVFGSEGMKAWGSNTASKGFKNVKTGLEQATGTPLVYGLLKTSVALAGFATGAATMIPAAMSYGIDRARGREPSNTLSEAWELTKKGGKGMVSGLDDATGTVVSSLAKKVGAMEKASEREEKDKKEKELAEQNKPASNQQNPLGKPAASGNEQNKPETPAGEQPPGHSSELKRLRDSAASQSRDGKGVDSPTPSQEPITPQNDADKKHHLEEDRKTFQDAKAQAEADRKRAASPPSPDTNNPSTPPSAPSQP